MKSWTIKPATRGLKGSITIPGDKSISHRTLIFASLAEGESRISNLLLGEDVLTTMRIFQQLGIPMSHRPEELKEGDELIIQGQGLHGLKAPKDILDCGNSGTTLRLMMGLLSAQPFESVLTGDESLNKRPVERVIKPISEMGGHFSIEHQKEKRFIHIDRRKFPLKGISHHLSVASAQVKSAILLAGLYASDRTIVREPAQSRDHTERMLLDLGVSLQKNKFSTEMNPVSSLKPFHMTVPGDFSSAAFFIVSGLIIPDSELTLKHVGLNPSRIAFWNILEKMADPTALTIENQLSLSEPVADLRIRYSLLKAYDVKGEIIPNIIDEIPIFCIAAAAVSKGMSHVSDAKELRVKESDRISTMCKNLQLLGILVEEKEDGLVIHGGGDFVGGCFKSYGDHRIAMSFAIAALKADKPSTIQGVSCVSTSFPSFFDKLSQLR